MRPTLYDIPIFFQFGCMILSCLFSLELIKNDRVPGYMKNFYWYSLIAGVAAVYALIDAYTHNKNTYAFIIIYDTLLIFHYVFLSLFINKALAVNETSITIKLLFFFCLLIIVLLIVNNDLLTRQATACAFANCSLVVFCCRYYFSLFNRAPSVNLLDEPSFWIVNGIFLGMCANVPIPALKGYLFINLPSNHYNFLMGIGATGYGIMHLFFIKGYLCAIKIGQNRKIKRSI